MTDPVIARPLAGALAFQHVGEIAEWSQAVQLIAMGVGLTGPDDVIADMEAEGASLHLAVPRRSAWLDRRSTWEDLGALIEESPLPGFGRRFLDPIYRRGIFVGDDSPYEERAFYRAASPQLWNLARTRDVGAAAAIRLLVSSLYSESEIVRVAGAVALVRSSRTLVLSSSLSSSMDCLASH